MVKKLLILGSAAASLIVLAGCGSSGEGSNAFGAGWYVLNPSGEKIDENGGGNGS